MEDFKCEHGVNCKYICDCYEKAQKLSESTEAAGYILECPFCGSDDVDARGWKSNDGKTGPACNNCNGTADTIDLWNGRFAKGIDVVATLSKFEEMRQGFASVLTCEELSAVTRVSMEAYHGYANKICVSFGGESVETIKFRG